MGLFKKAAVATGKATGRAAIAKARKANKHYCPSTDNNRHRMVQDRGGYSEWTGKEHAGTGLMYCRECGWTNHKK